MKPDAVGTQTHSSLFTPGVLAILGILLGILVPPLGILFVAAAIYRAGKTSNKAVLTLGIIGLVAVAASSGFYWHLYGNYRANPDNHTTTYTNFANFTMPGSAKNLGLSFSKPTNFIDTPGSPQTGSQHYFIDRAELPGLKNGVARAQIYAISLPSRQPVTGKYLKDFNDMFTTTGRASVTYTRFKNSIIQFLFSGTYPNTKMVLADPVAFTNSSIKANAWLFNYTAVTYFLDGSHLNYRGSLVYALGAKGQQYFFTISSLSKNWQTNSSNWQTILASLKIDQ